MDEIDLTPSEGAKNLAYWAEEFKKCSADQYYFFSNYCLINGEKPTITREEYYEKLGFYKELQSRKNLGRR